MKKEDMKAAIDELNEAHGLEVEYDDDADGKTLKAKLKEAQELAAAAESGDEPEEEEEGATEAEDEVEASEEEEAADEPAEEPAAPAKKAVAKGRKPSWPKGFVPTGDKVADTKTILDAAPKVSFLVPRTEGEDPRVTETVQINGYKYEIKKGHMVEIPKPVADLLARKYQVQMEVAQRANAYDSPEKTQALS